MPPAFRIVADFDRKVGDPQRHVDIAHDDRDRDLDHIMQRLVVDVRGCVRPRAREDVNTDPQTDFVLRPGVGVRPVHQLVPDPGQEADGRVPESKVDRGWLLGWANRLVRRLV